VPVSDAQEQACRRAAGSASATQIDVYREEGESGKSLHRTQLRRLLDRLPQYQTLHVWRIDRLTRGDLLDWGLLLQECEAAKWRLVAVGENLALDAPEGEFRADLSAILSRRERTVLVQRITAAQDHRVTDLGLPMGREPFGWH